MMQKVAFIYSFKESSWVSCQKIVSNLRRAYSQIDNVIQEDVNYSNEILDDEIDRVAYELIDKKPDVLIFLDHQPHPLKLLIRFLARATYKPRIIFHIYGDFTLFLSEWLMLETYLKNISVEFIVASEAQRKLVMNFLKENANIEVCPFLVDSTEFNYSPELRLGQRDIWQVHEKDTVFVYTGRLSYQKNIHKLLKDFSIIAEKFSDTHLYLYGNTDNLGDPFFNKWEIKGEYFRKLHKTLESFSNQIRMRIHFMGHVQSHELLSIYQGADYLINLSTHNDEDFGMSIAESLCSGLPVILTEWAGFMGFHSDELSLATNYVPVRIGKTKKIISRDRFKQIMEDVLQGNKFLEKKDLAVKSLNRFSIESGSKILKSILVKDERSFLGYSNFFQEMMKDRNLQLPEGRFMTPQNQVSSLYRKIYSAYVREN